MSKQNETVPELIERYKDTDPVLVKELLTPVCSRSDLKIIIMGIKFEQYYNKHTEIPK